MDKEFSLLLIDRGASVKDAMRQLDLSAQKILFVVDKETKLIGSLTDGDIRRWILNGGRLDNRVENACFRGTFFVRQNFNQEETKTVILKNRFAFVPIVDGQGCIVEFLTWDTLFDGKLKRKVKDELDTTVVIMAGGEGTRMAPFTQILPKPLIPVGEKSVIEVIIDKFIEYGTKEFYITVNYRAKIIKAYFEYVQGPYSLSFIDETTPRGTAGCLKELAGRIKKPFFVTNCDILVDADYTDMRDQHRRNDNDITLVASVKNFRIPYGVCTLEAGRLSNIDEKPEFNLLINTGMYILNPEALDLIPEQGVFHMTHLIDIVQRIGGRIGLYPVSENSWLDVGEWDEYQTALKKVQQ